MPLPEPLFFYDLVDPLSYLTDLELRAVEDERGVRVRREPLELRGPPEPLLDPDGPEWTERWNRATAHADALGVPLVRPRLVPWSRKAHELVLHAADLDREDEVRRGLFELAHREGRDLGRVDVLVTFARDLGLDMTHAKAVLDVDRHAERVAEGRTRAAGYGVDAPPALVVGSRVLRGFHNRHALGTFLG